MVKSIIFLLWMKIFLDENVFPIRTVTDDVIQHLPSAATDVNIHFNIASGSQRVVSSCYNLLQPVVTPLLSWVCKALCVHLL